jgi:hypothetical protein
VFVDAPGGVRVRERQYAPELVALPTELVTVAV